MNGWVRTKKKTNQIRICMGNWFEQKSLSYFINHSKINKKYSCNVTSNLQPRTKSTRLPVFSFKCFQCVYKLLLLWSQVSINNKGNYLVAVKIARTLFSRCTFGAKVVATTTTKKKKLKCKNEIALGLVPFSND